MSNKERYILYIQSQPSIPIYMRDWWLDSECGEDKWDVLLYEKEGNIEAFMTYYQPWAGSISMPIYSQSMGIWFDPRYSDAKYAKEQRRKQEICDYFISSLPACNHYVQNFHYTFTDWLPFYWKGYKQTTRYTQIIPDISDIEAVWDSLGNIKRNISRAKERHGLTIRKGIPEEDFFALSSETYSRQSKDLPARESLRRLIRASQARKQGDIWGAYDAQGTPHAVFFFVWQESCAYGIAAGSNYKTPNTHAYEFLNWEAIRFASTVSQSYDFQGSMLKGVEAYNAKFHPIQLPYYTLYKGKRGIRDYFRAALRKMK